MINYIQLFYVDEITCPYPNLTAGLVKFVSKMGPGDQM